MDKFESHVWLDEMEDSIEKAYKHIISENLQHK